MKKVFYSMMACALAFANVACEEDDVKDAIQDAIENANGDDDKKPGDETPGDETTEATIVLYSFAKKTYDLGESTEVTVELLDNQAKPIVADEEIPVTLLVDEASTAVEGVNFEIENKTAVVAKGSNQCTFVLKSLAPAAGETIVLGLQFTDSKLYEFIGGAFTKTTVTMAAKMEEGIYGTWVMNEVLTTAEYMEGMWGDMVTGYEYIPVFEENDKFIFEDGKLKTELTSTLKNYFRPESEFVFGPERPADKNTGVRPVDSMEPIALQMIELQNVNRYFSATETSEDKVAFLGVRIIPGTDLLDVYILDHESRSFMPEMADFGMYGEEKPTAWMSGMYINFTLKRAQ